MFGESIAVNRGRLAVGRWSVVGHQRRTPVSTIRKPDPIVPLYYLIVTAGNPRSSLMIHAALWGCMAMSCSRSRS